MKQFADDENVALKIPGRVKDDMEIWATITKAAKGGLPIPPPTTGPPLNHLVFVSDAAGRRPAGSRDETWLIQGNTAVYEMVGLLLLILTLHKQLKHQEIYLLVDNEAKIWS
jgi:hypothetical protein